ncbi:MAG: hypothetical protein HOA57_02465 [Candidatus Magasanikbacteria bacterium]|jgi:hypothetical protein|nr:hypothetical protein [Candidatus Magasanikbacteria bacterium]MBT4314911.1 hypothetical protein [Candidatus Magasanikbacteria bacterium]MBT4546867.1 hypothetical protein [Candidatus Magasanikbacteria bacterium]MBT6819219.1 hypothetical protein [Candidatus Magasanikbacteria bacterium]
MDGIGKILKKVDEHKPKQNKNIHSEAHYWADVISTAFGEKNKFGMYLGVIKKIGADRAQLIFNELKNSNVKSPGRLFIWKSNPKNFIDQNKKNNTNKASLFGKK